MQIWLHVNELPCYLTLSMSQEQLNETLTQHYTDYPSIRPVVILSEEETTHLIRLQPIQPATDATHAVIPLPPHAPITSSTRESLDGYKCFWIDENPVASSLAFLSRNPEFLEKIKGRHLVTLEDQEGLLYSILSHTWVFKEGYPHWTSNDDWEKDPYAINSDRCPIPWDKDLYYCNGPKRNLKVSPNSLIVIPKDIHVTWESAEDCLVLQHYMTSKHPEGTIYQTHSFSHPEERWVLHTMGAPHTQHVSEYVTDVAIKSTITAYSYLRTYLVTCLSHLTCLSPFACVTQYLGCLPKTPTELVITIRFKIKQLIASWVVIGRESSSYEGIIEREKQKRRRRLKLARICSYHLIYNIINQKPWGAEKAIGSYPYHTHKRGLSRRICWRECRPFEPHFMLRLEDLSIHSYLQAWLRYVWTLYTAETAPPPSVVAPIMRFYPIQ